MPRTQPIQSTPETQPVIDDRGYDQFGIGPLQREYQLRGGIWPRPSKDDRRTPRMSLFHPMRLPEEIFVRVELSGLVTTSELDNRIKELQAQVREALEAMP